MRRRRQWIEGHACIRCEYALLAVAAMMKGGAFRKMASEQKVDEVGRGRCNSNSCGQTALSSCTCLGEQSRTDAVPKMVHVCLSLLGKTCGHALVFPVIFCFLVLVGLPQEQMESCESELHYVFICIACLDLAYRVGVKGSIHLSSFSEMSPIRPWFLVVCLVLLWRASCRSSIAREEGWRVSKNTHCWCARVSRLPLSLSLLLLLIPAR